MWASSTWTERGRLLRRAEAHFAALPPEHQHKPLGWKLADFVLSTGTGSSTMYTYAKALRSTCHKVGAERMPLLDLVITGLSADSNMAEPEQARPITPAELNFLGEQAWRHDPTGRLALSLWLAWKTASRWADVAALSKKHFLEIDVTRRQVVVQWGDLKTNRFKRFQATGLTVIELNEDEPPETLRCLQDLLRPLSPETIFCPMTTSQFRHWMQSFPRTRHLSAHSIKRGAIDQLITAAAAGKLDARLIPLVAKHQDQLHQFPSSTLRYGSRLPDLARALGTQNATRHL